MDRADFEKAVGSEVDKALKELREDVSTRSASWGQMNYRSRVFPEPTEQARSKACYVYVKPFAKLANREEQG